MEKHKTRGLPVKPRRMKKITDKIINPDYIVLGVDLIQIEMDYNPKFNTEESGEEKFTYSAIIVQLNKIDSNNIFLSTTFSAQKKVDNESIIDIKCQYIAAIESKKDYNQEELENISVIFSSTTLWSKFRFIVANLMIDINDGLPPLPNSPDGVKISIDHNKSKEIKPEKEKK